MKTKIALSLAAPAARSLAIKVLAVAALLASALAVGACDDGTPFTPPIDGGGNRERGPGGELGLPDLGCPATLTAASPQSVSIDGNQKADLTVRLTDCKGLAVSAQIAFAITGSANGSTLAVASAPTDASGFARATVLAGTQAATFKVVASYQKVTPVEFTVTVNVKPFGALIVNLTYGGKRTFTEFVALLLPDQACSALDPFTLPTALQQAAPVASITAKPQIADIPVNTYAVAVTAKNGTDLSGFGCVGAIKINAGQTTTADVTIVDLPVRYNGVYLLDNQFDLTGALPPSVGNTLKLFNELSDDKDLTGAGCTTTNKQGTCGLDPAAFLLDFIYRQFCRWECASGEDFGSCSQTGHPQGDISALYLQNMMTWSGAKPYFPTLCGALGLPLGGAPALYVHSWLNQEVQKGIISIVPSILVNLLQIIGDLSSAFTNMHIKSQMTLLDVGPHNTNGKFEHVLQKMVITVHDLAGKASLKEFDLAAAGVSNLTYGPALATTLNDKLQIPTHSFQLEFGKLVLYIYKTALLPALGYTSTGQMFQTWVDCTAVGTWLNKQIGLLSVAQGKSFCDAGLAAAGTWVEGEIQKSISAATKFELTSGSCEAGLPLGAKREALTLINGVWKGQIFEGPFIGPLTGTFTGVRK